MPVVSELNILIKKGKVRAAIPQQSFMTQTALKARVAQDSK
jgi:hypothetical protein